MLPDGAVLVEKWRRLVAKVVDAVIVAVLIGFAWIPWLGEIVPDLVHTTPAPGGGEVIGLIVVVVNLVYEVAFLSWRQATPGKMLLRMVVRRIDEPRLNVVDVLKRQILTLAVSPFIITTGVAPWASLADPAWVLWDHDRQALHDKIARTVVVLRQPKPSPGVAE